MGRREEEIELLKKYDCPPKDDLGTSGVLLSDEIEHYVYSFKLIDPFDCKNLDPAAYKLTIGDEYSIGGERKRLYDESGKNEITIPPFEVAIIKTYERVNLPRFLIARWNIKVSLAYKGLLWVGGPQVDPGYVGYLFCPIYNLSNNNVTLKYKDPIAVIDFVKTTPFKKEKYLFSWDNVPGNDNDRLLQFLMVDLGINWPAATIITKSDDNKTIRVSYEGKSVEITLEENKKKALLKFGKNTPCDLIVKEENQNFNIYKDKNIEFSRPPRRILFDDYDPETLKSALIGQAKNRIDDVEKRVTDFVRRFDIYIGIIGTLVAVLFAALAIIASAQKDGSPSPWWWYLSATLTIFALVFSILAYTKSGSKTTAVCVSREEEHYIINKKQYEIIKILAILIIALLIIIVTLIALGRI